jgi:hypothetical protein
MPALRSPRRETFAQLIAKSPKTGKTITQCYEESGYSTSGHGSEAAGSRLLSTVEVQRRIAELGQPAVKRTQLTVEHLLDTLEANIVAAGAAQQHGAVNGAVKIMGELRGMFVTKSEIGAPGSFTGDTTIEQVVAGMVDQLGGGDAASALSAFEEMVAEVRIALEATAAAHATIIGSTPRANNEAQLGIELLRRRKGSAGRSGL